MTPARDQAPAVSSTEHAFASGLWMTAGYGLQGLLTVVSVAVLARLLTPAQFGVVSAALLAISFSRVLAEGAIGSAVIQHPKLRDEHVRAGFTLSLVTSFVLF